MKNHIKKILSGVLFFVFVGVVVFLSTKNIKNAKTNLNTNNTLENNENLDPLKTTTPTDEQESLTSQKNNFQNSTQILIRGINSNNQLGVSENTKMTIDSSSILAPQFTQIALGNNHSVGLTKTGEVFTWGHNDVGQLGREVTSENKNDGIPRQVTISKKIISIDASYDHTILLAEDGSVWGFGSNFTGQLGNGTNENSTNPVQAINLKGIVKIATGDKFTLALNSSGEVYGWGGSCAPSSERILKQFQQGPLNLVGGYYDPFIDPEKGYNQNQDCLNEDSVGIKSKVPKKIEGIPKIKDISVGYGHALMLTTEGKIWSFGCNLYGQLGQGKFGNFIENLKEDPSGNPANSIPKEIIGLDKVTSVSAGYRHSLALDIDGKIYAWGFQTRSEKQGSTILNSANPQIIYSPTKFKTIHAGHDYSLFIDTIGTSYAHGVNTQNLISAKDTKYVFEPTKLFEEKISEIAGGKIHIIGLKK